MESPEQTANILLLVISRLVIENKKIRCKQNHKNDVICDSVRSNSKLDICICSDQDCDMRLDIFTIIFGTHSATAA